MFKKSRIYCLYKKIKGDRYRVLYLFDERGVIDRDLLFDHAVDWECENLLDASGSNHGDLELFFSEVLKLKNAEDISYLEIDTYNQLITELRSKEGLYELLEKSGKVYPEVAKQQSFKDRFFKR